MDYHLNPLVFDIIGCVSVSVFWWLSQGYWWPCRCSWCCWQLWFQRCFFERIYNQEIKVAYITDYVMLESVNFVLRKAGFSAAIETLNLFRAHERIRIVNVDVAMFDEICKIFAEYPGDYLSLMLQ